MINIIQLYQQSLISLISTFTQLHHHQGQHYSLSIFFSLQQQQSHLSTLPVCDKKFISITRLSNPCDDDLDGF